MRDKAGMGKYQIFDKDNRKFKQELCLQSNTMKLPQSTAELEHIDPFITFHFKRDIPNATIDFFIHDNSIYQGMHLAFCNSSNRDKRAISQTG